MKWLSMGGLSSMGGRRKQHVWAQRPAEEGAAGAAACLDLAAARRPERSTRSPEEDDVLLVFVSRWTRRCSLQAPRHPGHCIESHRDDD